MANEDEIYSLNTLNRLQDRTVRGAKPGTRNTVKCGRVYVSSDASSATAPVKEYLVQGSLASKNLITGHAVFTNGSTQVVCYDASFAHLSPGDTIRQDGDRKTYVVASAGVALATLTTAYVQEQASPTGSYTAYKIIFGNAWADTVENTEALPGFKYDLTTAKWEETPGIAHTAPVLTGSSVVVQDGVTLHFVGKGNPPSPDIQTVGTVTDKGITVQHPGLPFVSMPVVPYPGDHSTLHVSRMRPGESTYAGQEYGSDYFVDYNQQPIYTPDQPPYQLRKQAALVPAVAFSAAQALDASYRGSWAVTAGTDRVTGIVSGTEVLEAGDVPEQENIAVSPSQASSKQALLSAVPDGPVTVRIAGGSTLAGATASGRTLDWSASATPVLPGQVLQVGYAPVPGSYVDTPPGNSLSGQRLQSPYLDYLLDPLSGYLTTVTTKTGAARTMQYLTLSPQHLSDKSAPINGTPLGSVIVNAYHGSALSPGIDYKIEGDTITWAGLPESNIGNGRHDGLRLFYEVSAGEMPVKYILYPDSYFSNGLEAYRMPGSFQDAEAVDIATVGTKLVRDRDYNINEKNGSFRIVPELLDTDVVGFEYLVRGNAITGEELKGFRTARYPVAEGSLLVRGRSATSSTILTEGVDYEFSYMTGFLSPLPGVTWDKLFVEYLPAAKLSCLVKKVAGQPGYVLRMEGEPAVATSTGTIQIYNQALSGDTAVTDIVVYDKAGNVLPLSGVDFKAASRILTFAPYNALSPGQVVLVSYTYAGADAAHAVKALPFAPLVTLPKTLPSGRSSFLTDGSSKAATNFKVGGVLLLTPRTAYTRYYHVILSNEPAGDGVNNRITVSGSFVETLREPSFSVTNGGLLFSTPKGVLANPLSQGSPQVFFAGDVTQSFSQGRLLRVSSASKDEVYRITHSVFDGTSTNLSIDPPALSSETSPAVLGALKVSDSVIYVEGDNAIVTSSPVYPEHPLWKINYLREDGYAEASVSDSSIDIREHGASGEVRYSLDRTSYEFAPVLAAAIDALGGGGRFQVEWLFTPLADFRSSYIIADNFLQRMPKQVLAETQLLRQRSNESAFTVLKYGNAPGRGDFHVESGILVLEKPILRGDIYSVAYLGVDMKRSHYGSSMYLSGRKIDPQPQGTKYRITSDYRMPDQFYLQTMQDADFYKQVVQPYLDSLATRSEGAQPTGSEGAGTEDPGNSAGGIQDNWFSLRDEGVKQDLLHRIHDYYLGRMATFANERAVLDGKRLGNLDFTTQQDDPRFNIANFHDAAFTALFGASKIYPVGYAGSLPRPDARFLGQYLSYGRANFFNYGGQGVAYASGSLFHTRGIVPGDQMRVKGTVKWYTVASVVSENEVRFTATIDHAPSPSYRYTLGTFLEVQPRLFPWDTVKVSPAPTETYQYEVSKAVVPAYPLYDDSGCVTASLVGVLSEPFGLSPSPSYSNILVVYYSTDSGTTWTPLEANLSYLAPPYTADRVVSALMHDQEITNPDPSVPANDAQKTLKVPGLQNLFRIDAETRYVANGVDVLQATDYSWPLQVPEKGDAIGMGKVLVFRSVVPGMLFQFTEPDVVVDDEGTPRTLRKSAASALGLPVGVVASGNTNPYSAGTQAMLEYALRIKEVPFFDEVLHTVERLGRGAYPTYAKPLADMLEAADASTLKTLAALTQASSYASTISIETDASSAIAASYDQATAAITAYGTKIASSDAIMTHDTVLLSHLRSDFPAYASNMQALTVPAATLRAQLTASLEGPTHLPTVLFDATSLGHLPHVAYGNFRTDANVFGKPVFPSYASSLGGPSPLNQLPGTWGTAPADNAPLITITGTQAYSYEVLDGQGINIYYNPGTRGVQKISWGFNGSPTPTIGGLLDYLNTHGVGIFTATLPSGPSSQYAYRSTRASFLQPVALTAYASGATILSSRHQGCSAGAAFPFRMDWALHFVPKVGATSPALETSDTSITIHEAHLIGGLVSFDYADYNTLGELYQAITSTTVTYHMDISINAAYDMYPFQLLAKRSLFSLPFPTGGPGSQGGLAYLGVQKEVVFWAVNDKNIDDARAEASLRASQLATYPVDFVARSTEIAGSLQDEQVVDNKDLWMYRLANRQDGPCVKVLNLKKQLLKL